MPELPEIQAHAERLDRGLRDGRSRALHPAGLHRPQDGDARSPDAAYGRALVVVGRRGKHLLLDFGELTFVVHLMQGGRLKPDAKQSAKPRFGQARWRFADGRALLLTEAGHASARRACG